MTLILVTSRNKYLLEAVLFPFPRVRLKAERPVLFAQDLIVKQCFYAEHARCAVTTHKSVDCLILENWRFCCVFGEHREGKRHGADEAEDTAVKGQEEVVKVPGGSEALCLQQQSWYLT